jgi:hypothetical protein
MTEYRGLSTLVAVFVCAVLSACFWLWVLL